MYKTFLASVLLIVCAGFGLWAFDFFFNTPASNGAATNQHLKSSDSTPDINGY